MLAVSRALDQDDKLIHDETLVGVLALSIAAITTAIAVGPWTAPYRIRSFAALQRHYGKTAARCAWLVLALFSGLAGSAILTGVRPSYATPPATLDQNQ